MAVFDRQTTSPYPVQAKLVAALLLLLSSMDHSATAHEGHAPLPTKGARVDGEVVYLSPDARKAVRLTTAEIDLKDLQHRITATASVIAPWKQHAIVTSKIGGKIGRVFYRAGDQVRAGDTLAELESLELVNEQLELIQYQLELELAQQTLDRVESLGGQGIVAGKEVSSARSIQVETSSALEITKQKLLGLGLSEPILQQLLDSKRPIRTLPIVAPRSGVLVHVDINPGQVIDPTEHLFEILDLSTVWVEGMVVGTDISLVKQGQPVDVLLAALPGKKAPAVLDMISMTLDASSRALPVRVSLANPNPAAPLIKPGMFGAMQIVTGEAENAIACPVSALIKAGGETYVFVEQAPGQYLRKRVILGLRTAEFAEIKDGIFPGDRVVLDGSRQLASFFIQGTLTLTKEAQRNIDLVLQPATQHTVEQVVTINGVVDVPPDQKAFGSPLISGKISEILVDLSQPVEKDQHLAEVRSLEFQDLQLNLLQMHTRLKLASQLLESARQARGAIAQQQLIQRETDYQKLANEVEIAQSRLTALGLTPAEIQGIAETGQTLPTMPIRSPISGYVVSFEVIPGQMVTAGDALFEIHDLSEVLVRGHVFESDLGQVSLGQTARIRLASNPDFIATAELVRSNDVLDVSGRVLSFWAALENPQRELKDNMLARITISTGTSAPTLAVALPAVLNDSGQSYVFVQAADQPDRFERRAVTTGKRDDRFIEIKSGLKPGEVIAIRGIQELQTAFASIK